MPINVSIPDPEEKEGERGFTTQPYLRFTSQPYSLLSWKTQDVWRNVVESQPIAVLCREAIVERISVIDWRIEPVDPTKRQELRTEINYYTRLFEENNGYDVVSFNEWVLSDALDLPFGSGIELIYKDDDPSKRLVDYSFLDGATLFPTNNLDFPVVQMVPGTDISDAVVFPKHAINRMYYSPRRKIRWRGWGQPPPEKIYLALQMLVQGDRYYWKLLIDTPEAGILDLIDMSEASAKAWIESMRVLLEGQDPLKVPVLYEHTKEAKFIPFGRPPSEIMYDSTTHKYAAITCAGYGLSLSDIGIQVVSSGGETLAGSIRQERNTKRKGIGFAKEKMRLFRNRMLPRNLNWVWIDPDEEQQVARGRAKLSSASAYSSLIGKKVISPKEARQDFIGSGLASVSLPEDIPEEDFKLFEDISPGEERRPNMLTATQPPSSGGEGEIRASKVDKVITSGVNRFMDSLFEHVPDLGEDELVEASLSISSYIDVDELFSELMKFVEVQFEYKRLDRSIFSFSRWKSFDSIYEDVYEEIETFIKEIPNKIADKLIYARSYALDNSDKVSDNFIEFKDDIVNELIRELAIDFGEKIKNII